VLDDAEEVVAATRSRTGQIPIRTPAARGASVGPRQQSANTVLTLAGDSLPVPFQLTFDAVPFWPDTETVVFHAVMIWWPMGNVNGIDQPANGYIGVVHVGPLGELDRAARGPPPAGRPRLIGKAPLRITEK
jgi:hypothetical protein